MNASAAPTNAFTAAASAGPMENPQEPEADSLAGGVLLAGFVVTGLIGAPHQFVLPETIKAVAASLMALLALALWAWRAERPMRLRWSHYLAAPFGLALFALASIAWSPAATALTESVRWLVIGVIAFVGLNVFRGDAFTAIARSAYWTALLLSLLALSQFWFGFSMFPAAAEPGANFGNRNFYAEVVAMALPLALWVALQSRSLNAAAIHGLGLGLILVGLLTTGTRAALIAAALGLLLTVLLAVLCRLRGAPEASTGRLPFAVALLAPLAVVFTLGWLPTGNPRIFDEHSYANRGLTPIARTVTRLQSLTDDQTYQDESSFGIRRAAWKAGGEMIAAHPLRGVGAGAWNTVSPLYSPDYVDIESVWLAHNEPVQLVAELGLAGWAALLALAGLLASSVLRATRQIRQKQQTLQAAQTLVAAVSIAMFGMVGLAGLPLHAATTCYLLALLVAYLLAIRPPSGIDKQVTAAPAALLALRLAAAASLVVAVFVGFQGMRSDLLVQRGASVIRALALNRDIPKESATALKTQAMNDYRQGMDIFSNHGLTSATVVNDLAELEEPLGVLWLSGLLLDTRPHVPVLRCNRIRAYADLQNLPAAVQELEQLEKSRPSAACLPLSRFVYEYKAGQFPQTLASGRKLIQQLDEKKTPPNVARYIVDTSYRAAVRIPDIDAAEALLRVRAERWADLKAGSWLLIGQIQASRTPTQLSPNATEAFRTALAAATPQERPQMLARIPEAYRASLK